MKAAIMKGAAQSSNETKTYGLFQFHLLVSLAAYRYEQLIVAADSSSKIVAIVAIVAAACSC